MIQVWLCIEIIPKPLYHNQCTPNMTDSYQLAVVESRGRVHSSAAFCGS